MKMITLSVQVPAHVVAEYPAVIDEVRAARRLSLGRPPARRDAPKTLIAAARHVESAMRRYDNAVGTKDERRALHYLLIACRSVSSTVKTLPKTESE